MPTRRRTSFNYELTNTSEWVLLEEIWKAGFWEDNDRHLDVPDFPSDLVVTLRHNMIWPPWHWEVGLGPGLHTFYIADGWNKFMVRINTPGTVATVQWIL